VMPYYTRRLPLESATNDTAKQELILFLVSAVVAVIVVGVYYFMIGRKEEAHIFSSSYREVGIESSGLGDSNISPSNNTTAVQ